MRTSVHYKKNNNGTARSETDVVIKQIFYLIPTHKKGVQFILILPTHGAKHDHLF